MRFTESPRAASLDSDSHSSTSYLPGSSRRVSPFYDTNREWAFVFTGTCCIAGMQTCSADSAIPRRSCTGLEAQREPVGRDVRTRARLHSLRSFTTPIVDLLCRFPAVLDAATPRPGSAAATGVPCLAFHCLCLRLPLLFPRLRSAGEGLPLGATPRAARAGETDSTARASAPSSTRRLGE